MMPYLLGKTHPEGKRIVDSQKCFRAVDIEEVGDNRHTTFFEMLGNWSLGDYFKKEQLAWFYSFLTKNVNLEPEKLFVTVFRGRQDIGIDRDDEAAEIWQGLFGQDGIEAKTVDNAEETGMADGRIFYYPAEKNWWSRAGKPENMPVGEPGGPDSEVFYDFGAQLKLHENSGFASKPCHPNCDCGRFMEIANNVFMTYLKTDRGFEPLQQKNIDFGGGFERILAAANNDPDVFKTALFIPIIEKLQSIAGYKYDHSQQTKKSYRVIADHMRAALMLAADGVTPSSKEQGYFARRLVRRAIRYAKMVGIVKPFVAEIVPIIIDIYKEAYPEIALAQDAITQALVIEEAKFAKTLENGLRELDKLSRVQNSASITGALAFKLYETYGFPFELTQEIASEQSISISLDDFNSAKKQHADASRAAGAGKFKGGLADHSQQTTRYHTATHLLHAALRHVIGSTVGQRGSNITTERLRFDFTHDKPLTQDQKQQVETLINNWIKAGLPVTVASMAKDEAMKSGAMAFFGEKYPDQVTVYTVGLRPDGTNHDLNNPQADWVSKELCGGPHVQNTSEIGQIEIFKDKAVSAGVRRVYLQSKAS
jgi:alanyl-tRNA synthetase